MTMLGLFLGSSIDEVLIINEPLPMYPYVNVLLANVRGFKCKVKLAFLLC